MTDGVVWDDDINSITDKVDPSIAYLDNLEVNSSIGYLENNLIESLEKVLNLDSFRRRGIIL